MSQPDSTTAVKESFLKKIKEIGNALDLKAVDELRVSFLGRKGEVQVLLDSLKNVPKEERPAYGKAVNELRAFIEESINSLREKAEQRALELKLSAKPIDASLPTTAHSGGGSLHPVSLMRKVLVKEFRRLGFRIWDGPEVDLDFYNFSALNFKDDHPARDMQDTFFVKDYEKTILRTHTSNIQIHAMLNSKPPMRVVSLGRVYRCDSDITHTPMFHQIEGFVIDQHISMAHMKGVIDRFLKAIYGDDLSTRLRPSFFPFVEPGGEVDLQCVKCRGKGCQICKKTGWLEIGGLGMIHPNVLENIGLDSEAYLGFAFGFGIDRMAMLKYSLNDLRQLFDGNYNFLNQFPVYP
ncbi:MAG: phenylalanine--tRNA ligase subunit alpha [Oligoflexales bacterium]